MSCCVLLIYVGTRGLADMVNNGTHLLDSTYCREMVALTAFDAPFGIYVHISAVCVYGFISCAQTEMN
jgi:hypothetical protein